MTMANNLKTKQIIPIYDLAQSKARIENGKCVKWWSRKGSNAKNFKYFKCDGEQIADEKSLARIKSLVLPPAWKCVRISPTASNKVQAVGIDKSGRIQSIYHPKFVEKQKQKKFSKIEKFGEFLPNLRKTTNEHLSLDGFPREKVLAVMIRLINSLYIRVGTEKSVQHYKTYGITTLQNRHLEIGKNGTLIFSFVGKHHIKHRKVLVDKELAEIMQDLKSLGKAGKLFHYLDADQKPRPVKPSEINDYLKSLTAPEYSAKDFRTWGATILTAIELAKEGVADDEKIIKKNIVKTVKKVAEYLGNTPNVCRNSYIHPVVLDSYQKGLVIDQVNVKSRKIHSTEFDYLPEETGLIKLFERNSGL